MVVSLPRPRWWMLVPATLVLVGAASTLRLRGRSRAANEDRQPADVRFMIAMHDAFRRDLDRLESTAEQLDESGVVPEGVRAGWDTLREQLHSHHVAEDDDLWPILRTHLDDPDHLREVDTMVYEHRAVPTALDAVEDALARGGEISANARYLAELIRAHLEHEEQTVVPLLEQYLSRAEWRQFLLSERDRHAVRERPAFLAWVLDDASDTDRAAVMAELPRPARLGYHLAIKPRYDREHRWQAA